MYEKIFAKITFADSVQWPVFCVTRKIVHIATT